MHVYLKTNKIKIRNSKELHHNCLIVDPTPLLLLVGGYKKYNVISTFLIINELHVSEIRFFLTKFRNNCFYVVVVFLI